MSEPSIHLAFTLKRSTWEFLLRYLEEAAAYADGEERPSSEFNIEVCNTANTVRSALQTEVPASEPDWLLLG